MSCLEIIGDYAFRSLGYGERLLPRSDFTLCHQVTLIGFTNTVARAEIEVIEVPELEICAVATYSPPSLTPIAPEPTEPTETVLLTVPSAMVPPVICPLDHLISTVFPAERPDNVALNCRAGSPTAAEIARGLTVRVGARNSVAALVAEPVSLLTSSV